MYVVSGVLWLARGVFWKGLSHFAPLGSNSVFALHDGFNSKCEERLYAEFCGPAGGESVGDEDDGAFDWAAWEAGSGARDHGKREFARGARDFDERMVYGRYDSGVAAGGAFHFGGAGDVLRPDGARAVCDGLGIRRKRAAAGDGDDARIVALWDRVPVVPGLGRPVKYVKV